jgi:aspartate kinase
MKIIVIKFGGTSVGSLDRIKKVTKIIISYVKRKYRVIVITSAMSGVTNELLSKTRKIAKEFSNSEKDVILSTGEQIACALIAGKLNDLGYVSRSWLSWQIPIMTEGKYSSSRIVSVYKNKVLNYLKKGGIPIIAGFQGINSDNRLTTLERGGSDATVIMCARFFRARECIIYTDVEGVYTTDPRMVKSAKKIKKISYEEMLEMASLGAKVMQPASIQDARLNRINVKVKSSFKNKNGTLITKKNKISSNNVIRGISFTKNDAKFTLIGIKDRPGVAASIFKPLYQNSVNVDMVVQNISGLGKETDLTFTINIDDLSKTHKLIIKNKLIKYKKLIIDKNVSKVSVIGVGMVTTPGVTYRMFKALAEKKINIEVISTSEIKISVLVNKKNLKKSVETLHKEFKLDNL